MPQFELLCERVTRLLESDPLLLWQVWDNNLGIWLTLAQANIQDEAMAQGIPVLRGPYVVDFGDVPHDGDTKTLWTPQEGDVLLRLFPDFRTVVQWDHGQLWLAQGLPDNTNNFLAGGQPGYIANADNASNLDTERALISGGAMIDGADLGAPYICRNTDPFTVLFRNIAPFADGIDPTAGHVELYALVARAMAP